MDHTAFYNFSWVEVAWVVVALVGLALTLFNCIEAWSDYRFILSHGITNGRRIVGRTAAYTEVTRVVVQVIFVGIGLLAGTISNPPYPDQPKNVLVIGWLLRYGLIASSALIAYQSYLLRKMRRHINH